MLTRAELKAQAKQQLKGKVWWLFLCTLIVSGISMILGMIPFVGVIATYIIAPALSIGLTMVYLSVTYGEDVQINMLFDGFRGKLFGKSIALFLLTILYTLLWSLLFVIPGIIKAYSYSMAFYILAENGDILFNTRGITGNAIENGLIKENMVSDGAIGGKKINWSSFVTEFNKDSNTHKLNSSKVLLDGTNQTLDVHFSDNFEK